MDQELYVLACVTSQQYKKLFTLQNLSAHIGFHCKKTPWHWGYWSEVCFEFGLYSMSPGVKSADMKVYPHMETFSKMEQTKVGFCAPPSFTYEWNYNIS